MWRPLSVFLLAISATELIHNVAGVDIKVMDPSIFASSTDFPLLFDPGFDIVKVIELAKSKPAHSWEYGTTAQALLELYSPKTSVFGSHPFPVPSLNKDEILSLQYAAEKIVIGVGKNGLSDGEGAAADPACLGVAAIMLGKKEDKYAKAATSQLEYLIHDAPRWSNDAISHRVKVAELW